MWSIWSGHPGTAVTRQPWAPWHRAPGHWAPWAPVHRAPCTGHPTGTRFTAANLHIIPEHNPESEFLLVAHCKWSHVVLMCEFSLWPTGHRAPPGTGHLRTRHLGAPGIVHLREPGTSGHRASGTRHLAHRAPPGTRRPAPCTRHPAPRAYGRERPTGPTPLPESARTPTKQAPIREKTLVGK